MFFILANVVDTVAIFARITQTDAIWHLAEQSAKKNGVALVLTFDRSILDFLNWHSILKTLPIPSHNSH